MRLDTFSALVAMLEKLPPGPRKAALALECDRLARAFAGLVEDVSAAAKTARPK